MIRDVPTAPYHASRRFSARVFCSAGVRKGPLAAVILDRASTAAIEGTGHFAECGHGVVPDAPEKAFRVLRDFILEGA